MGGGVNGSGERYQRDKVVKTWEVEDGIKIYTFTYSKMAGNITLYSSAS
jgi:hypothetical protein